MSAGESAYDVARRQREKAARLEQAAARWEQGAAGEVAVARALDALPPGWVVLHDLAWPGRPRANIDHVAIGPGGIFVIDAKNWSGSVEVRDQVLRQNGRAREDAVISVAEAAIALQQVVPVSQLVAGVLCFVRDDPMTGWARDVMVCTTVNLVSMLASRPIVLDADAVQRTAGAVRGATSSRSAAARSISTRPVTTRPGRLVRPTATSYRRQQRTPWAKVVAGVVLLALVLGGGLASVGQWAGEQLVDRMAPTQPAEPKQQQKQKQQRDGAVKNRPAKDAATQG